MAMHLLLLETGGTFGSEEKSNACRDLKEASVTALPVVAESLAAAKITVTVKRPCYLLSENMRLGVWQHFLDAIGEMDLTVFDGVIVTHGTDTLAYTAALTAFYLMDPGVPLVFTAADRPVTEANSNGLPNFFAAMDFIAQGKNGVFAVYRNGDGTVYAHRGSRLRQMEDVHHGFYSHKSAYFARYEQGKWQYRSEVAEIKRAKREVAFSLPCTLCRGILQIFSYPGLDYSVLNLDGVKAILLRTYHSGTFCTQGEKQSLAALLARLGENVPVIIAGGVSGRAKYAYALTSEKGVFFVDDVAPEALYAKMLLAFGSFPYDAAMTYIRENVAGEVVGS